MIRLSRMNALSQVLEKIARAEARFRREPGSARLVAVSKTRSSQEIADVAAQGQRAFGENYLQEALPKIAELAPLDLEWHYIGSIQSNKTAALARHFHWVHTIDREKIARRLSEQRGPEHSPLQVCIQVNISGEASKSGVDLDALPALAAVVAAQPHLRLRGLMALPAPTTEFESQRSAFRRLAQALADLHQRGQVVDTLSMGTSDDFVAAIAEGATLVRIGTAVFGHRA
jgi:PLP dependent protein